MITSHHIARQIAAERQRDLRAAAGGWSLADMFRRLTRRPSPGRGAEGSVPARGADAATPARAAVEAGPRREPRIRRAPAATDEHRTAAPPGRGRAKRRPERTRS